ncbi:MAG: hypothetical protein MHPSP_003012 [Paramarteilia canceri]
MFKSKKDSGDNTNPMHHMTKGYENWNKAKQSMNTPAFDHLKEINLKNAKINFQKAIELFTAQNNILSSSEFEKKVNENNENIQKCIINIKNIEEELNKIEVGGKNLILFNSNIILGVHSNVHNHQNLQTSHQNFGNDIDF